MSNHLTPDTAGTTAIARALQHGHLVDITTTGRRSGAARRLEVVFHNIDGMIVISGMPGPRDWFANLLADPRMTFHLKGALRADLPATARPITDPAERRAVMARVAANWKRRDLERMLAESPLVEVVFDSAA